MSMDNPLLLLLGLPVAEAEALVKRWGFVPRPVPAAAVLVGLLEPGTVVLWNGGGTVERAALGRVAEWDLLKERAQGTGAAAMKGGV
jgi:hypothetical protein